MIIFHDHLDGGLNAKTLLEMAIKAQYEPIMNLTVQQTATLMNKSLSESLEDFLSAFIHTIAVMQTYDNLEQIAFEAAEAMHNDGIKYYESRFAPLYSVNNELNIKDVIKSVLRRRSNTHFCLRKQLQYCVRHHVRCRVAHFMAQHVSFIVVVLI